MADRPSVYISWRALVNKLEDLRQASRAAGTAADTQLAYELGLEDAVIRDLDALTASLGED